MLYEVLEFCLYFVIAVCIAMVFIVSFMRSVEKDRELKDRLADLLTGVVLFYIFKILLDMWKLF